VAEGRRIAGARRRARGRAAVLALVLLAGCGGAEDPGRVAIALNWKPEPEFGGLYEARRLGAFERRGLVLDVTGGPGAPVVQMLAAGDVGFGIASADEVVIARDRGVDLVAVFATYQTSPQGIMVHASRGLGSLAELFAAGGTLAWEPGVPYTRWLEHAYDLSRMKIVPYGYSIAPFLADPDMAQQVFVTAEPIAARRAGAEPEVFLVADSGYNPYTAVVVVRADRWREQAERVHAFVAALREGWRAYLDDPAPANALMGALNREMDAETFALGAAAQAPLIEDGTTRAHGLGHMTLERWAELGRQLRTLGLLDHDPVPEACFVNVGGAGSG
jgi:NitT/TauT family transport system substrate-binding protein